MGKEPLGITACLAAKTPEIDRFRWCQVCERFLTKMSACPPSDAGERFDISNELLSGTHKQRLRSHFPRAREERAPECSNT